MKKHFLLVTLGIAIGAVAVLAQGRLRQPALTALDYIEIQQLMTGYGHYIDTCSNNGYDYADLYTNDGTFVDAFTEEGFKKGGLVRAVGREALARAAGGGSLGCKDVGWKDWSHLMINPLIKADQKGVHGRVFVVAIGEKGPRDVQRFGGYEDEYVHTGAGWRIRQRTHVRTKAWHNPLLRSADLN
jgi:SnoaL-like domain